MGKGKAGLSGIARPVRLAKFGTALLTPISASRYAKLVKGWAERAIQLSLLVELSGRSHGEILADFHAQKCDWDEFYAEEMGRVEVL